MAFRKLKGVTSSSTSEPISVRIGQWGDAEVVFNPNALPLTALKDVSDQTPEDGDLLVWDQASEEYLPSSVRAPDIFKLKSRETLPQGLDVCDRGKVVFIENSSEGIASGYYLYDGINWIEWILF